MQWQVCSPQALEPRYDLPWQATLQFLLGTCRLMVECRYIIQLSHVKGHQDNKEITVLTWDATLNIEADSLAKDKLACHVTGPMVYYLPFAYSTCSVGSSWVVKNLQSVLHNHINGFPAVKYWQQCCKPLPMIWATIDWSSCQCTMSEIPLHCQRWVSKFISGHFAHGKNMQCWQFHTTTSCPQCTFPIKDKSHILRCPALAAVDKWQSFIKELKSWLWEQNTSPILSKAILASLQAWYQDDPSPTASQYASQLLADQNAIGWDRLIESWLPQSWHLEQEQFWSHICPHKSSKCWTSELIKKFWDVAWDLWDQWNEALHNDPANHDILDSHANDQIWKVYEQGSAMLPRDALALLREPLSAQLQKPLATKTLWLQSVQAAWEQKARHDHGSMSSEQQIMQQFLGLE